MCAGETHAEQGNSKNDIKIAFGPDLCCRLHSTIASYLLWGSFLVFPLTLLRRAYCPPPPFSLFITNLSLYMTPTVNHHRV